MERTLKQFAEWYIGDGGHLKIDIAGENAMRVGTHSTELVLYREPPFQVTLLTFFPGYVIPPHSHKHVSTYSFSLTGDGHALVGKRHWTKRVHGKPQMALRIPVPANIEHSGHSDVGTVFLSVQKWEGREPGFLSEDWTCETAFKNIR